MNTFEKRCNLILLFAASFSQKLFKLENFYMFERKLTLLRVDLGLTLYWTVLPRGTILTLGSEVAMDTVGLLDASGSLGL